MQSENKTPSQRTKIDLPKDVPALINLYFYIAGSCNLACKHCWIDPKFQKNPENGSFLSFEYIKSAITQAKPLGLNSVKLTGGEPLLHPQFKKIFNLITKENVLGPIETNGILIDEKMAEFLASGNNRPLISISIDGSKPETHENLRGVKGSFEKSVNAVKYLVKNNIRPQIICTLHKGNIAEIKEVVKMAEDIGCESVKFNLIQEIGRGSGFSKDFGLTIQKMLELYHFVENKIIPQTNIRVVYDIPVAFYPLKRFLKGSMGRCHIFNILGIISTGEISLCGIGTTVPELIYGHIKNNDLKEIWTRNKSLIELRKNIPSNFEGICGKCIHKEFCLGSCIANNYFRTGKLNASYSFCKKADIIGLFPRTRKK